MYTIWLHAPVSPSSPLFRFFWAPHVEEPSLVETLETPELLVVVVLVVVEINSCTTSAPAPSTADRFPVTLTDKLVSPKALEACHRSIGPRWSKIWKGCLFVLKMLKWLRHFKNIRPTSFFSKSFHAILYYTSIIWNLNVFPKKKHQHWPPPPVIRKVCWSTSLKGSRLQYQQMNHRRTY